MSMGPRPWPHFIFPDSLAFLAFYLGDPAVGAVTAFDSIDARKFTFTPTLDPIAAISRCYERMHP